MLDGATHPLVTGHPPAWASEWGQDRYGVWASFTVRDVTQRMRWIPPGRFLMGSPPNEKGRHGNETQHEVTISKGYWLADTACTQQLWQAVMGGNPSRFTGPLRPVEMVSWFDCKEFLKKLATYDPRFTLRLPTEAEWEHACRAGTDTPFCFGNTLTTDQANYRGSYPWQGGHRSETVDVASLPCNPWGLFQMHGNTWEWCEDRFGNYSDDHGIDPLGPEKGDNRVLCGGSWFDYARYCRSASRYGDVPGARSVYIGFRLARGQERVHRQQGGRAEK